MRHHVRREIPLNDIVYSVEILVRSLEITRRTYFYALRVCRYKMHCNYCNKPIRAHQMRDHLVHYHRLCIPKSHAFQSKCIWCRETMPAGGFYYYKHLLNCFMGFEEMAVEHDTNMRRSDPNYINPLRRRKRSPFHRLDINNKYLKKSKPGYRIFTSRSVDDKDFVAERTTPREPRNNDNTAVEHHNPLNFTLEGL